MHIFIKRILILITACCLILYGLQKLYFVQTDWLDLCAARCTYPWYMLSGAINTKITDWHNSQATYADIKQKYEKLHEDYLVAINELVAFKAEHHANEKTKELVAFAARYNIQGPVARIMVKHLDDTGHYYLVNVGSRDGIKKDMIAIYQRHLIGRVIEVYDWYSKVILLTDEKSKISAYTSKTHAPGIVQGYNTAERCTMTYVSHLFQVVDNDLIISSGQGQIYPQGFCLGKIEWHTLKSKELYHYVELKPIINLRGLSYVMIIDPSTVMQF
jgi:rod shape-determining protein MreC